MKIKHLFDALEIDNLDPESFPRHLADAWKKLRFSEPAEGYEGSDQIGATLLARENFAWTSSGWFDANLVTFPSDMHPETEEQILDRLERMVDRRQDKVAIQYLWVAFSDQVPPKATQNNPVIWRTKIGEVAKNLAKLRNAHPLIFDALLAGRLWQVIERLEKVPHNRNSQDLYNTISWVYIIWALFDLQVICFRLFHVEWNALEGGMDSPHACKLETLESLARQIQRYGTEIDRGVASGGSLNDLSSELREFIRDNGLVEKAHGVLGGLAEDGEVPPISSIKGQVNRYFKLLERKLEKLLKVLQYHRSERRPNLIGHAHLIGASHGNPVPKSFHKSGGKSFHIRHPASTVRYSVPALTALLYSVERIVAELDFLPNLLGLHPRPLFGSRRKLVQIERALFAIYRDLFVRPVRSGWQKDDNDVSLSEHYEQEIAPAVEKIKKAGGRDPGLEPLHDDWRERPSRPLLGGATPEELISPSDDPRGQDPGRKKPGVWKPGKIDRELPKNTRALRDLPNHPEASPHFQRQAKKVKKDFADDLAKRFMHGSDN